MQFRISENLQKGFTEDRVFEDRAEALREFNRPLIAGTRYLEVRYRCSRGWTPWEEVGQWSADDNGDEI